MKALVTFGSFVLGGVKLAEGLGEGGGVVTEVGVRGGVGDSAVQ